jgi:diguanylate cyclase (GGDEF)-like protein/PAS domain S-box-containing protein
MREEGGARSLLPTRLGRVAAVALPSAGTALAFVIMSRYHLVGDEPVWVILILLAVAAVVGEASIGLLESNPNGWALHIGVGLLCLVVGAVIYTIGWGPTLAIGFLFIAARALDIVGSRVWPIVVIWTAISILAGQIAIGTGVVATYVPSPSVQGLAVLSVLGVWFVTWILGGKVRQNEIALAERDHATNDVRSTLSLLRATLDSTADGILVVDNDGKIAQFNTRFTEMWCLPDTILESRDDEAAVQFVLDQLRYPEAFLAKLKELYAHPDAESDDILLFKDGRVFERHSLPQKIEGEVVGRVWSFRDVTDHHRLLGELEHQAFHDGLTGLANRSLLRNRLDHALLRSHRTGIVVGVLFCDIDGFKIVNDTLGHDVGDLILVEVGQRIDGCLREDDTVARLGGDEFAIILDGTTNIDAVEAANRVLEALREPFNVNRREINIRASIGVTLTSTGSMEADALLCEADIAMYAAKASGRDCLMSFEPEMQSTMAARHALHADLRHAVRDYGELSLHYQPVFDLVTGRPVYAEALVRWNHPQRGFISPEEFIPVAEEMGLLSEIGRYVLREACQQVVRWRLFPAAKDMSVAVNVSAYQLYDNRFVGEVEAALVDSGLPPSGLVLELTESALLSDTDRVHHRLARLRELGVRIAIDDFGTGYSSLSYLRRLPIDVLKIDRSFVSELGSSSLQQARSLVRSIVGLGHDLCLTVVAEGIETQNELDDVRAARCDLGQGFFLGEPLPPAEFEAALRHQQPVQSLTDFRKDAPESSHVPPRRGHRSVDKAVEFSLTRWR